MARTLRAIAKRMGSRPNFLYASISLYLVLGGFLYEGGQAMAGRRITGGF